MGIFSLQVDNAERALPIVCVKYIRIKIRDPHKLEHSLRKESESLAVIEVAVCLRTFEIVFVIDEVEGNAGALDLIYAEVLSSPRKRHLSFEYSLKLIVPSVSHRGIERYHHADIRLISECRLDRRRKRAHNIAETSGSRKRKCFSRCIKNFHFTLRSADVRRTVRRFSRRNFVCRDRPKDQSILPFGT